MGSGATEQGKTNLFGLNTVFISWDIGFNLKNGKIKYGSGDFLQIENLEVEYDPLKLRVAIDFPSVCVGGQCLVKVAGKCIVRLPKICIFEGREDIVLPINLSGVQSRLTILGRVSTNKFVNPRRPSGMSDIDAHDKEIADEWQVRVKPSPKDFSFEPIDVPGTVENIINKLITDQVDGVLSVLPGWAKSLIKAIIGELANVIKKILRIPGDIVKWVEDLLQTELHVHESIIKVLIIFFTDRYKIAAIEEPIPIMKRKGILIPVLQRTKNLEIQLDESNAELLIRSTI